MPEQYELIPTSKQRGATSPRGWVQLAPNMNPKRRTMTEDYLNQRMPRGNTVAINQNYVRKVLENPRTPRENREVVIAYVLNHPEKFTPLADHTDDPVQNEWARKRNGVADFCFMKSFSNKYL